MRIVTCLAAALSLACLSLAGLSAAPDQWHTFTSREGRLSILMPGTPTREVVDAPSPFGPVKIVIYALIGGVPAYQVGYVDYPAAKVAKLKPDALLQMVSDGMRKMPGATIVTDKRITVQGYPGREQIVRKGPVQVRQRNVLVGNRIYIVNAAYPDEADYDQKDVARYLDSFRIVPPPKPTGAAHGRRRA